MRFEAITVVKVKIMVLWVLIFLGGWVSGWGGVGRGEIGGWVVSKHFQGTQYLHLHGSSSLQTTAQQATFLGLLDLWRWWHYIPFQWHSVTSQKAWILSCHENLQSCIAQRHLWVHMKHIINLYYDDRHGHKQK